MLIYMLYSGDLRESLRCPCNLAFAHEHTEGVRAGAQIWGQNYCFFLTYPNFRTRKILRTFFCIQSVWVMQR